MQDTVLHRAAAMHWHWHCSQEQNTGAEGQGRWDGNGEPVLYTAAACAQAELAAIAPVAVWKILSHF